MDAKTIIRAPAGLERRAAARLTGRYLMSYAPEAHASVTDGLSKAGFPGARPVAPGIRSAKPVPHGSHMALEKLGIAVIDPRADQEDELESFARQNGAVRALIPERIVRAIETNDYVRGWRDATDALSDKVLHDPSAPPSAAPAIEAATAGVTWGLIATHAYDSHYSGKGIKLAVLDTGLDVHHPDFAGRKITTQNFVGDETPFHDGHGHGTHCAGTAAGPLHPATGARYGIAYNAEIFSGRVLDDNGSGGDTNIIQAIHWAIENGCAVISLSLGAHWFPGDPAYLQPYEQVAELALQHGALMVVAAGNDYGDPQYVGAVGSPGNSPSVLTVAAVDGKLATASFSDRVVPQAPGVKGPDLAGPGVAVYSSWPVARGSYRVLDGTSMATPHVAGLAALMAESNPSLRGQALKTAMIAHCRQLGGGKHKGEVGAGLVQAP